MPGCLRSSICRGPRSVAGVGLLLALVLGIVAAIMSGHFSRFWPWAAIGVVIVVFAVMTPFGTNPMGEVRRALGLPVRGDKAGDPPRQPAGEEQLRAAQANLRPELLSAIGIVALAVLVWLMETKPF